MNELDQKARKAVDAFRDFAREHGMDFRQRDPLVMAIHDALDAALTPSLPGIDGERLAKWEAMLARICPSWRYAAGDREKDFDVLGDGNSPSGDLLVASCHSIYGDNEANAAFIAAAPEAVCYLIALVRDMARFLAESNEGQCWEAGRKQGQRETAARCREIAEKINREYLATAAVVVTGSKQTAYAFAAGAENVEVTIAREFGLTPSGPSP